MLMIFALFSVLGGLIVLATSIYLVIALRKEYEKKIVPWLWSFAVFTLVRILALIFFAIVNDLIFAYNVLVIVCWSLLLVLCLYCWVVVYSLYLELSDLTKMEDLAHLRVSGLCQRARKHRASPNNTMLFVCFTDGYAGFGAWLGDSVHCRRIGADHTAHDHHRLNEVIALVNVFRHSVKVPWSCCEIPLTQIPSIFIEIGHIFDHGIFTHFCLIINKHTHFYSTKQTYTYLLYNLLCLLYRFEFLAIGPPATQDHSDQALHIFSLRVPQNCLDFIEIRQFGRHFKY